MGPPPPSPSPPTPRRRAPRGLALVAGALAAVAIYLWDDLLFAAPVVGLARVLGTGLGFVVGSALYFAGSTVISLLALRAYDRASPRAGRLSAFVERHSHAPGRRWVANLTTGGSIVGFVLSSVVLGGIVTTLLLRHAGMRIRIEAVAITSSAIFAVTFVGFYSGISRATLGIGR